MCWYRSSIFLATYCGLGWLGLHATLPLARLAATRNEVPMLAQLAAGHVAGAMCALGLFFEKPSRRQVFFCTTSWPTF